MIFYESHRSNKTKYLYHEWKENYSYGAHLHKSFEFALCVKGELEIIVNGKSCLMHPGNGVLILPNHIHSYHTQGDRHFMCIFSCDYVRDFYEDMKGKTFSDPMFFMEDLSFADKFWTAKNSFALESLLYHICASAYESCPVVERDTAHSDLLEKIIYYVQEKYREPITLKSMAAELGYSYNYLSSFINTAFGTNFSQFLNMHRVEHAAAMLLDKNIGITDVAEACGFGSIRNFNRIFSQYYQMTPTEYVNSSQDDIATVKTLLLPPWGWEDSNKLEGGPSRVFDGGANL